ncbi:MAG: YciI family protein [Nitrospinota bacterium]|nr:YciI family protein [Nitrospinota bacterium]
MPNFMIAYHGGDEPGSKKEGAAQLEKWKAWVKGLGDRVVNPGTPLTNSTLVTSTQVAQDDDPNAMKGFAVVEADSIEAAVEIAQSDPFLANGGIICVSEMMEMK